MSAPPLPQQKYTKTMLIGRNDSIKYCIVYGLLTFTARSVTTTFPNQCPTGAKFEITSQIFPPASAIHSFALTSQT